MKCLLILLLFSLYSCAPDSSGSTVTFDAVFEGTVTDASTGDPIEGAVVYVSGYSAITDTTAADGSYTLNNAPAADRVYLKATASGYKEGTLIKTGRSGQTTENANISLLPVGFGDNKIVIILTWASTPTDLDSHLYVGDSSQTKIDHTAKGDNNGTLDSAPFAGLDVDDTNGNGPETITIRYNNSSTDYNGTYRYFIHDFKNGADGELSASQAVVTVYTNGEFTQSFDVPTSNSFDYWHVFDMDSSGNITSVNQLLDRATDVPAP